MLSQKTLVEFVQKDRFLPALAIRCQRSELPPCALRDLDQHPAYSAGPASSLLTQFRQNFRQLCRLLCVKFRPEMCCYRPSIYRPHGLQQLASIFGYVKNLTAAIVDAVLAHDVACRL